MPEFIALLRAVNVAKRQLKIAEARKALEEAGFGEVESHIQTGNFLVDTAMRSIPKIEAEVGRVISEHAGFEIVAVVRRPQELPSLVEAVDGIPEADASATTRYVLFCDKAPTAAARTAVEAWDVAGERAFVIGKDVLMDFAVPFHRARLTGARLEKMLGVTGTARNMTVVRAMAEKWSK
jgi:uncharacterized protein (DUF1697 family)